MDKQLKKAINLAKKTGDRIIVFDANYPEDSFVLIDLNDYEKMIENKPEKDLTSDDLTDKINSDVAMWRNQDQDLAPLENDQENEEKKHWEIPSQIKNSAEKVEE